MSWQQVYDPMGSMVLSTLLAAIPVAVMLIGLGFLHMKAHVAAAAGLVAALVIAVAAFGMPAGMAGRAAWLGALTGLLPIGWIVLNIIFLHQLTERNGSFKVLQDSIAGITEDRRLQLLLIAFSFGAFFEGAAGFGTPVAVTAAMLIGLGFSPLAASGLSLIANTAPVAYGALGTPILTLAKVHDYDVMAISAMVGRQLPFFSLLVPFWLIWAFAGFRGMLQIWPAILVTGAAFAIPQFLVSNFHGPWLVDIIAAISSMIAVLVLLKFWKPSDAWKPADAPGAAAEPISPGGTSSTSPIPSIAPDPAMVRKAWIPWALLSVLVFVWGVPAVKTQLDKLSSPKFNVPHLHNATVRTHPVVPKPTPEKPTKPEEAVFKLNWLSATGTGILVAALLAGLIMGFKPGELVRAYFETIWTVRFSLITIAAMLALGYVTKYSGTDATLGLALAKTGSLYPFFGTLLGWLGVALTGSDTASNVLFGSLQKITAEQVHVSPILMAAANSSGGVMGKMVDAQSIVVASTATNWYGHEGSILRYVFFHSLALAALVGILVYLQAYVPPFTSMVVK